MGKPCKSSPVRLDQDERNPRRVQRAGGSGHGSGHERNGEHMKKKNAGFGSSTNAPPQLPTLPEGKIPRNGPADAPQPLPRKPMTPINRRPAPPPSPAPGVYKKRGSVKVSNAPSKKPAPAAPVATPAAPKVAPAAPKVTPVPAPPRGPVTPLTTPAPVERAAKRRRSTSPVKRAPDHHELLDTESEDEEETGAGIQSAYMYGAPFSHVAMPPGSLSVRDSLRDPLAASVPGRATAKEVLAAWQVRASSVVEDVLAHLHEALGVAIALPEHAPSHAHFFVLDHRCLLWAGWASGIAETLYVLSSDSGRPLRKPKIDGIAVDRVVEARLINGIDQAFKYSVHTRRVFEALTPPSYQTYDQSHAQAFSVEYLRFLIKFLKDAGYTPTVGTRPYSVEIASIAVFNQRKTLGTLFSRGGGLRTEAFPNKNSMHLPIGMRDSTELTRTTFSNHNQSLNVQMSKRAKKNNNRKKSKRAQENVAPAS